VNTEASALYLFEEFFERHFSLRDEQHILDDHLVLDEVHVPQLTERQVGQHPRHAQLPLQPFPVTLFHCLRLELHHQHVDTSVRLQHAFHVLVGRVSSQANRQIIQLVQQSIQRLTNLPQTTSTTGAVWNQVGNAIPFNQSVDKNFLQRLPQNTDEALNNVKICRTEGKKIF